MDWGRGGPVMGWLEDRSPTDTSREIKLEMGVKTKLVQDGLPAAFAFFQRVKIRAYLWHRSRARQLNSDPSSNPEESA